MLSALWVGLNKTAHWPARIPEYLSTKKRERIDTMTKENFLTVRWNNLLALGLGLPALVYIIVALSNSLWMGRNGMIGLALIGALY
jgi:hypothetical protein